MRQVPQPTSAVHFGQFMHKCFVARLFVPGRKYCAKFTDQPKRKKKRRRRNPGRSVDPFPFPFLGPLPNSFGSLRSSSSPSLLVISIDRLCRLRFASFVHFSLNIAYLHSVVPRPRPTVCLSVQGESSRFESSPSCQ